MALQSLVAIDRALVSTDDGSALSRRRTEEGDEYVECSCCVGYAQTMVPSFGGFGDDAGWHVKCRRYWESCGCTVSVNSDSSFPTVTVKGTFFTGLAIFCYRL